MVVNDQIDRLGGCFRFLEGLEPPLAVLDDSGDLKFANPAWTVMFGALKKGSPSWLESIAFDDVDNVRRTVDRALREQRASELEFSLQGSGGSQLNLSCTIGPVRGDDGDLAGLVVLCQDVTERYRREKRLAFMAGHDPLTGLANRRAFEEELGRAASRVDRGGRAVVLMLDLDHLKQYNDARGHLAGDQALVNLAMLLRTHVRASDLPARIGGDEFAVLLENASVHEAQEIADRVGSAVRSTEFVDGAGDFALGLSGGLALLVAGADPMVAVDRADVALYEAKSRGRDQTLQWTEEMGGATSLGRVGSLLRGALADGRLTLAFQPIVRLDDGSVSYYEALARLHEEDGSELWPSDFLPVAERLGLMGRLTRSVVALVLQELAETPAVRLSVNLSPGDLSDAQLAQDVESALAASGVSPERLVFEITESAVVTNLSAVRLLTQRLSRLGCRFVLADFGTALGAFALLREVSVSEVKLSRAVVQALEDSVESRAFVRAVREFIESGGKSAVAAFVENDMLLADAREAGFRYGQGFRLGVPSPDLGELVAVMESRTQGELLG